MAAPKKPGGNAGKGRIAGVPNKTTTAVREAILEAARLSGQDGKGKDGLIGYLMRVASEDVKAFSTLLGRVLPTQISAEISFLDRLSYEDRVALEAALAAIPSGEGDAADGASATQH